MSSKNELIEVALMSFMVEGYQKTSLSKIANQLGVSKPAVYYYFPNKKALFLECIDVFFKNLGSDVKHYKVEGKTAREKLENIVLSFSNPFKDENTVEGFNLYYFIFDAIKHVPEVKDLYMNSSSSFMQSMVDVISEGIEAGEIRDDIDMEVFLVELGVLIEGFAISHYMGYFNEMPDMPSRVFDLVWRGIAIN